MLCIFILRGKRCLPYVYVLYNARIYFQKNELLEHIMYRMGDSICEKYICIYTHLLIIYLQYLRHAAHLHFFGD